MSTSFCLDNVPLRATSISSSLGRVLALTKESIFPYTGTQADHSQAWRGLYPGRKAFTSLSSFRFLKRH
jgi:hypothetical protein